MDGAIGDRIAFTPPLIITADELADMCARFRRGLDDAYAELRGNGSIAA